MDKETRTLETGAELRSFDDNKDSKPTTPDNGTDEPKDKQLDVDDSKLHISGYALKFDTPSKDLGGFVEVLDKDSLSDIELDGIKLLNNHDFSQVLASSPETMTLTVDATGLKFEADLDPEVSFAKDVYQNVKNGNLDKCSFGFATDQDEFTKEGEQVVRHIKKINSLFDVSIVAIPAYDDTDVQIAKRSFDQFLNQNKEKKDTKNMTEKVLIDNDSKTAELRSFENYVKSRGEVRDGLTTVEGSPLVPSEIVTPIFRTNENSVDLASYVNKKSVSTKSGSYPIAKNNNAILATKEELAEIGDIDSGITAIDFNVTTKAGKIFLSSELVADSNFDIESEVKAQLEHLVMNTNNRNIMDLLNKLEAKTATDLDGIKHIYNVDLDPSLEKMIIVNQTSFDYLDTLKDTDGRYLLQYSVADPTQSTLFGSKIVVVPDTVLKPVAGEVTMFLGSLFDYVCLFQRDQVTAKWTNFDSYSEGLSIILRNDYKVVDSSAMVKVTLKTAPK
ncbi:phage major capsid protein [Pediococcus acidilactici]|uniref:phage major capsid protein n=1 Tax=Pediococcus acidilactici TaxID=1254 RepID=UPI00132FBE09|nr:phage major capsid protein [Pediococcus acidilactici]KAF0551188.1 phage major capsid protein [Pediococcus acidilactici]